MISFKVHPINGIGPVLEPISACDVEFEWLKLAEKNNKNSRMDETDAEDCDSDDSDSTSETDDHGEATEKITNMS